MSIDTEKAKLKRILLNPKLYAANFQYIKTKAGELRKLKYNKAQLELNRIWEEQAAKGKPVRIIVLKARQEGVSTFTQGRGFHFAATKKHRHFKIVAHEDEATENLFQMSKTFYDNLPEVVELSDGTLAQVKPEQKYSNRKELVFKDRDSQITFKTAGKDTEEKGSTVGRSQTVHFLHCSEVAFWPAAKNTLVALLQTVPDLPGTVVILESTANGIGDHFYQLWQDAKAGRNDFIPVFLPWWTHEEYVMPLEPGEKFELDEDEKELIKRFNLTLERLKWRRWAIKNKCGGDVEQFHQEYPSDDQEAFLVSGRPFFDAKALVKQKAENVHEPKRKGYLEEKDGVLTFVNDPKGYIWVWEEPQPLAPYCIGGDVAEGLEKEDYNALQVINRDTFGQVAEWHGHYDPDLFGDECVKLAKWYNRAWIGPEVNNHGLTTNKAIVKLKYPRLFTRKVLDEKIADPTDKLGWRTDVQSRPVMLDAMKEAIREGTLKIRSERLLSECMTFVRNDKGKPEAQTDCFDDLVLSMAICLQMHALCPMSRELSPEEQRKRRRQLREEMKPQSSVTGY